MKSTICAAAAAGALVLSGCGGVSAGPLLLGTVSVPSEGRDAACVVRGTATYDYVDVGAHVLITGMIDKKVITIGTGKLFFTALTDGQCVYRFSVRATEPAPSYTFAIDAVDLHQTLTAAQLAQQGSTDIILRPV